MKLYAVLGEKLGHTLSPQIHSHLLKALEIESCYCVIESPWENLPKIIDAAKTLGYHGLNVTIPYKEAIMPYLDEISPEAKAIGAINTIKFENNKSYGYNTDYFGFTSLLKRSSVDPNRKNVVLFGAGGAAKALISSLKDNGAASILVVSNSKEELSAMKAHYSFIETTDFSSSDNFEGDIVINATPVGMYPNSNGSIVQEDVIKRFNTAVDIVYNPLETMFLRIAKSHKLTTVNGLYMLIDQAIKAQEIFQNTTIDISLGDEIYGDLSKLFI